MCKVNPEFLAVILILYVRPSNMGVGKNDDGAGSSSSTIYEDKLHAGCHQNGCATKMIFKHLALGTCYKLNQMIDLNG